MRSAVQEVMEAYQQVEQDPDKLKKLQRWVEMGIQRGGGQHLPGRSRRRCGEGFRHIFLSRQQLYDSYKDNSTGLDQACDELFDLHSRAASLKEDGSNDVRP